MRRFFAFVLYLFREIGDENAYRRHLAAHGLTHSGEQWRVFFDAKAKNKYQRAKCC